MLSRLIGIRCQAQIKLVHFAAHQLSPFRHLSVTCPGDSKLWLLTSDASLALLGRQQNFDGTSHQADREDIGGEDKGGRSLVRCRYPAPDYPVARFNLSGQICITSPLRVKTWNNIFLIYESVYPLTLYICPAARTRSSPRVVHLSPSTPPCDDEKTPIPQVRAHTG